MESAVIRENKTQIEAISSLLDEILAPYANDCSPEVTEPRNHIINMVYDKCKNIEPLPFGDLKPLGPGVIAVYDPINIDNQ